LQDAADARSRWEASHVAVTTAVSLINQTENNPGGQSTMIKSFSEVRHAGRLGIERKCHQKTVNLRKHAVKRNGQRSVQSTANKTKYQQ
jgi:hypothetical protein